MELSEDSNNKSKCKTLSLESFKRTGYDYLSFCKRVIVDFIMPKFITFSNLSGPKSRTFVNVYFSRFKMGGFM